LPALPRTRPDAAANLRISIRRGAFNSSYVVRGGKHRAMLPLSELDHGREAPSLLARMATPCFSALIPFCMVVSGGWRIKRKFKKGPSLGTHASSVLPFSKVPAAFNKDAASLTRRKLRTACEDRPRVSEMHLAENWHAGSVLNPACEDRPRLS
jgi:hypothetical protein